MPVRCCSARLPSAILNEFLDGAIRTIAWFGSVTLLGTDEIHSDDLKSGVTIDTDRCD
jgi:hypothetical protein